MVIFYHMGFDTFSGGYVGVDIFFVISGYLITSNITDRLKSGSFSFSDFYIRRLRRLIPALLFTYLFVLVCGFLLLSIEHYSRLGQSTVYAIFAISNFYFWSESGYFDSLANIKPLLHLWSLAVEEQFYLVWPTLLLILYKIKEVRYQYSLLLFLSLVSLLASEYYLKIDPDAVFYLAPFRVFEFTIGASLLWFEKKQNRKKVFFLYYSFWV